MTEPRPTIYQELLEAGCELDHHESDLYVKDCEAARKILRERRPPVRTSSFRSEIDGEAWIDVPFAWDPFWDKADKRGDAKAARREMHRRSRSRAKRNARSL